MGDFILLNFLLLLFLTLTALESLWRPKLPRIKKAVTKIPIKLLFIFFLGAFFLILFFILQGPENFVRVYLDLSLSLLIAGHAIWVSLGKNLRFRTLCLLAAAALTIYRFTQPSSIIIHNLFIILCLLWLGPFLTQANLLTRKRFIIISLLWFFYDIVFVWLTPLAQHFEETIRSIGMPLALIVGNASLGTADLLWSNLLLSLGKTSKWMFVAMATLIGSNLLLGWYSHTTNSFSLFPLLVLWVPLNLLLLHLFSTPNRPHERATY